MAAIIHPVPSKDRSFVARPPLRVIEGGRSPRRRAALYRRRRALAVVILVTVASVAVAGGYAALSALRPDVPGAHPSRGSLVGVGDSSTGAVVVVRRGDTLWSIARRFAPGGDVRAAVDRLASVHGTGPLQVGERLPLPGAQGGRQTSR